MKAKWKEREIESKQRERKMKRTTVCLIFWLLFWSLLCFWVMLCSIIFGQTPILCTTCFCCFLLFYLLWDFALDLWAALNCIWSKILVHFDLVWFCQRCRKIVLRLFKDFLLVTFHSCQYLVTLQGTAQSGISSARSAPNQEGISWPVVDVWKSENTQNTGHFRQNNEDGSFFL